MKGLLPTRQHPGSSLAPGGTLDRDEINTLREITSQLMTFMVNKGIETKPKSLSDTINKFAKVRDLKRAIRQAEKLLNVSLDSLNRDLLNKMEEMQMQSVSNDKYTCSAEGGIYPNVVMKKELDDWLKENDMDELRSIHSRTLIGIAKDHMENGKGKIPGVEVFFGEEVRIRKKG